MELKDSVLLPSNERWITKIDVLSRLFSKSKKENQREIKQTFYVMLQQ